MINFMVTKILVCWYWRSKNRALLTHPRTLILSGRTWGPT